VINPPPALLRYIVEKGAITVDGISLTVNRVDGQGFAISLVPHTQRHTHLWRKPLGARVNLEVDLVAKHIEKLVACYLPAGSGLTLEKLKEHGFVKPQ
jgi:riboflavin synthase